MTTSSLVSTAAAAAQCIPWHCVICFEEFNLQQRYPVVLPCGHTYICQICSKKITRCHECRESVFSTTRAPTAGTRGGGPPLYPQGRYQAPTSPATPKTPGASSQQVQELTIPLPAPKNIVLISMMEAAQRQASEQVASQNQHDGDGQGYDSTTSEVVLNGDTDDNDEDEFDTSHIISGLITFSGASGTYAVKEPDGLTVLSRPPGTSVQGDENADADADQENGEHDTNKKKFIIRKGQTCQVVTFANGIAKLARGKGFIVVNNSSQLVKVGPPLDKCCRLEGMMETLSLRGRDLQTALNENQKLELELRERVEAELSSTPSCPVISEPPSREEIDVRPLEENISGKEFRLLVPNSPRDVYVTEATDSSGLELVGENTMRLYAGPNSKMPSSPNSIDNSDFHRFDAHPPGIPRYRPQNSDDDLEEFAYGCGSALFGKHFLNFDIHGEHRLSFDSLDGSAQAEPQTRLLADTAPRGTTGSASSPARQGPNQNQNYVSNLMSAATPILSSSFDAVDWRTGMSGHRGLSKSSPRSNAISRSVRTGMSEHRGIGASRPGRHSSSPSSSPASVPRLIAGVEYQDYLHTDKF